MVDQFGRSICLLQGQFILKLLSYWCFMTAWLSQNSVKQLCATKLGQPELVIFRDKMILDC